MNEAPKSIETQFHDAIRDLGAAEHNLARMRDLVSNARVEEVHARNRVDAEQDKFDDLVALVKKTAPKDTAWKPTPVVSYAPKETR